MGPAEISRTGMDVEWQRLQVIANNIANMNSVSAPGQEPFRPSRLISGAIGSFAGRLTGAGDRATGTRVIGVEAMPGSLRRSYEPGHPLADPDGFVTYPDVDHAGEMTLLIQTSRTYEANLAAMSIAYQMYAKALELGRGA